MKSMTGFSIIMLGIFTSLYSPKTIEYCSAMMSQLVIKIFYCFILQSAVPNFTPDGIACMNIFITVWCQLCSNF